MRQEIFYSQQIDNHIKGEKERMAFIVPFTPFLLHSHTKKHQLDCYQEMEIKGEITD